MGESGLGVWDCVPQCRTPGRWANNRDCSRKFWGHWGLGAAHPTPPLSSPVLPPWGKGPPWQEALTCHVPSLLWGLCARGTDGRGQASWQPAWQVRRPWWERAGGRESGAGEGTARGRVTGGWGEPVTRPRSSLGLGGLAKHETQPVPRTCPSPASSALASCHLPPSGPRLV